MLLRSTALAGLRPERLRVSAIRRPSTFAEGRRVKPSPRIVPVTGKAACKWIAATHRHLPKLQGALFAVGVANDGEVVGVGTAGNPARVWQGTGRFVITRVAVLPNLPMVTDSVGVEHAFPACTMIYRALCAAGKSLGYREAWTYTLPEECGQSLRAAGFVDMGLTSGGEHDRPSRRRSPAVRPEKKRRWMRCLTSVARDSGRHAQRGDPSGAPSEGCQSGGAEGAASPIPTPPHHPSNREAT